MSENCGPIRFTDFFSLNLRIVKSPPLTVNKCFEQLGPGFRKDSVPLEARPVGISRIHDGSGNEDVTS